MWEALLKRADKLGCDYIATGHYARVRQEAGRYILYKGCDARKDQSYALWGLSQASLSRTLFPLGHLTKDAIRAYAQAHDFASLAQKPESYEICFIPDNDYRGFLKRRVSGLADKVAGGDIVLEDGTVVGTHQGYPFYTVGQRRGLNLALGYPVYVTQIQPEHNRVVVGKLDELARDGMYVHKLNLIKYPRLAAYTDALAKVRYNDGGTQAVLHQDGALLKVFFGQSVAAVAPGQAAVFYEGDDVLGGGWIKAAFRQQPKD